MWFLCCLIKFYVFRLDFLDNSRVARFGSFFFFCWVLLLKLGRRNEAKRVKQLMVRNSKLLIFKLTLLAILLARPRHLCRELRDLIFYDFLFAIAEHAF